MLNQIKVLYSWDYLFILVVQYKVNCYSWRKKLTTEPIDCHWIMYKVRTKMLYIVLCKYKNMNLYNARTKELQCLSTEFSNEHIGVGFCYSFNQKIYIFGSFFLLTHLCNIFLTMKILKTIAFLPPLWNSIHEKWIFNTGLRILGVALLTDPFSFFFIWARKWDLRWKKTQQILTSIAVLSVLGVVDL